MSLKDLIFRRKNPAQGYSETIPLKGHIAIRHLGPNGELKKYWEKHNLIVNVGKFAMASRTNSASPAAFNYLALGSDSTAAAAAQSLLLGELTIGAAVRNQASISNVTTTVTNDTAQLYYSWAITASVQIQEVAAFNLSGVNLGQMLGRQVVTAINAQNGDTVQVTYKFQY